MDYSSLTDDEIRARLTEAGVSVGPIVGKLLAFIAMINPFGNCRSDLSEATN